MNKKFFIPLFFIFGLFTISLSIYTFQKQQALRVQASAESTVYFSPTSSLLNPIKGNLNEPINLDIFVNPGRNKISTIRLEILYNNDIYNIQRNSLVLNSSLPIIEGPVINTNNGTLNVTLSVGIDKTKAISTTTKLGTLKVVPEQETGTQLGNTNITFGTKTQAYSIAPIDHAYDNVIATAMPAYIIIGDGPGPDPTDEPGEGTIPVLPTNTLPPPLPTNTQGPTLVPTVTPTPGPNDTVLNFRTLLDGIGNGGDSTNPNNSSLSNKNPRTISREFTIEMYDASNKLVSTKKGIFVYNANEGLYKGTVNFGPNLATGKYIVKVKNDNFLKKRIPGIQTITPASKLTMAKINLIAGDVNNDNNINVLDYNSLMNCYTDLVNKSCTDTQRTVTDLNDDSIVNQIDYNLLIREISVQHGE